MLHLIEEDQKWWSENKKEVLKAVFVQHFNCLIPVISEVFHCISFRLKKKI